MSFQSMSEMANPMQQGPPAPVTKSNILTTLRTARLGHRGAITQWAAQGTGAFRAHVSHFSQQAIVAANVWDHVVATHLAATQAEAETIKVLLVCLAILIAVIVGIAVALLWRSDGQTLQGAILKGGAGFAGTVALLILLMNAVGLA